MTDNNQSKRVTFVLLSLTFLGVSLGFTIFPLLILPLEKSLNISHSLAGLLYTVMFVSSAAGRFIESFGADHYGKEIFLLYSGFLAFLGTIGFTLAPYYWLIIISVLFLGLGNGLFVPAGFAAVSELFPEERGKFIGLFDSIFPLSALGAFAITSIGNFLGSWRYSIGLIGVYLIIISTVLFLTYGPRERKKGSREREPFRPIEKIRFALKLIKGSPIFLKVMILIVPVSIFAKGSVNFIPAYMIQGRGLPSGVANVLYLVFMALIIPGKTLSGYTLDRKGARWTFLLIVLLIVAGFTLFSQIPGIWALSLGIFLVAPGRGGVYTTMHAHLLDNLSPDSVDLLYGFFMAGATIIGSIGPGLTGALIDNFGFQIGFLVLIIIVLATVPVGMSLEGAPEKKDAKYNS